MSLLMPVRVVLLKMSDGCGCKTAAAVDGPRDVLWIHLDCVVLLTGLAQLTDAAS